MSFLEKDIRDKLKSSAMISQKVSSKFSLVRIKEILPTHVALLREINEK
jgi:hypothetical protein